MIVLVEQLRTTADNSDSCQLVNMHKSNNWDQNSIQKSSKKVHSKSIVSISRFDDNAFFTSSEDRTIRMWDLRLHSSVKMFRNAAMSNLTNCENDGKSLLFVGSEQHLFSFDVRREGIFVQDLVSRSQEPHLDDIEFIKLSQEGIIGAGDHEGDVRLYNLNLECSELLDQGHNNIVNAVEFVTTQQGRLCISGGFDCKLVHWKIDEEDIAREIDLQELFTKQEIENTSMPFIFHIYRHKTTLFATTETGHVISYPTKELKKHKYILKASLARVVQVKVPEFNENLMISLSRDGSFSLFDHTKRFNGAPLFLQKYRCTDQPNWVEVMRNQILVSSADNAELSFFTIK